MAASVRSMDRSARAVPLLRAYWFMPLATGAAIIVTAAFMLIEVLILEARIQDNVTPINNEVASIRTHTDDIKILTTVDATAKDIRAAADPLSGQAATILNTVGTIQGTVASIDAATGSINSHAANIDGTVNGASIVNHARLIAEPAESIRAGLTTTTGRLAQVITLVQAVVGDTDYLAGNVVRRILSDAAAIDNKLP